MTHPLATEIADAVAAGRSHPRAVVAAALARSAQIDPAVRALTVVRAEAAHHEADALALALAAGAPPGPLAGVPVAVKEEFDVAGLVTTLGGRGVSTPARADSAAVARLRAAGAIVVAKTTMPEFGQFPFTESAATGVTLNPHDPAITCGGSSGGSAVAVATGMVPLALGTDSGGSVRIPASCCGVVGFKPERGRASLAPAPGWHALTCPGVLARSVADAALGLDAIAGAAPGDRWPAPPLSAPLAAAAGAEPRGVRVAWTLHPITPAARVDPEVAAATRAVVALLGRLGHLVRQTRPRWPGPTHAFMPQFYAGVRTQARLVEHPDRLEPRTRQTATLGAWATPRVVERAIRWGEGVARALDARVFADADLLVLPTLNLLPPPVGLIAGLGALRAQAVTMPYVGNTALFNVTGHPVLALPAGRSAAGWPIGVQLVARKGREDLLVAVGAQLERAQASA